MNISGAGIISPTAWIVPSVRIAAVLTAALWMFQKLPCKGLGQSIFDSQKDELLVYLGSEFVKEIEKLKETT
jgi:hypothetical protein